MRYIKGSLETDHIELRDGHSMVFSICMVKASSVVVVRTPHASWLLSDGVVVVAIMLVGILCQMIFFQGTCTLSGKQLDTSSKPTLLCSPVSPPSCEQNFIYLASLSEELANFAMLFIFHRTKPTDHTPCRKCFIFN